MKQEIVKIMGIVFVMLIIVNLVLFLLGKIKGIMFWSVIIVCAIVAYKILQIGRAHV